MKRRDFIKAGATIGALSLANVKVNIFGSPVKSFPEFPRYRGFNLLAKFSGRYPRRKFDEEDFEIMADWGFDFARIPMSYWNWASIDNWYNINEDVLKDIDEVVDLGRQYKIHINLNFHRVPGYCINGRNLEPVDLFDDTPENMQKALDATVYHWKIFAARYKGIPNSQLSFDLINEPPSMNEETRYVKVAEALVRGIREEDPGRLIIADGKDVGRTPVYGIADLGLVQSTRGYDPMSVSHYTAHWVPKDAFQTFEIPTWPLKGNFGVLNSRRTDVKYEKYKGHKLDRKMLELIKEF